MDLMTYRGVCCVVGVMALACTQSEDHSPKTDTAQGTSSDVQDTGDTAGGDFQTDDSVDGDVGTATQKDSETETKGQDKPVQYQGDPCEGDHPWQCDPLTSTGCEGDGMTCDWTVEDGVRAFTCEKSFGALEGQDCRLPGKRCAPGLRCLKGTCFRYCCGEAECDGTGYKCAHREEFEPHVIGGSLGLCAPVQKTADVCGDDELPWECDPFTNAGCDGAEEVCVWHRRDGVELFLCIEGGSQSENGVCSEDDGLYCAPGLACVDGECLKRCCANGDCDGDSICTNKARFSPKLTGGNLGVCVDQPDPCPWECVTTFKCDGVAYAGFACGYATSCCKPSALLETAGATCPAAQDDGDSDSDSDSDTTDAQADYECQDAMTANETCPALHFEMEGCPQKRFCCELDPSIDTASVKDTGGGADTDGDSGTDSGEDSLAKDTSESG